VASELQLISELSAVLQHLQRPRAFPKGQELFHCGDEAKGVYLIEAGKVSLLVCASARRPRVFATARGGAVLGLSESISGDAHKLTAEATEPTRVSFVDRDVFMRFLRQNQEFCLRVVRLLSEDVHYLYGKFREESAPAGRSRKPAALKRANPSAR
jgi:CRP/FNR family transcriptional regulator, cyclic AMP receptor protein